jgi:hypothetical protein
MNHHDSDPHAHGRSSQDRGGAPPAGARDLRARSRVLCVLLVLGAVVAVAAAMGSHCPKLQPTARGGWRSAFPVSGMEPAAPEDLAAIRRARRGLPPPSRLEDLLELWEAPKQDRPPGTGRPLGFELEQLQLVLGGQRRGRLQALRVGCFAVMVSLRGGLVETLVQCFWPLAEFEASAAALERELSSAFRIAVEDQPLAFAFRSLGPFAVASAVQKGPAAQEAGDRVSALLGSQLPVDVPADLAASYSVLLSPTAELPLGYDCGFTVPRGLAAARALRDAGRVDLLRNVLRGLNPEGRYYAARALRDMRSCDAADERTISRLPETAPYLITCAGGSGDAVPSERAEGILPRLDEPASFDGIPPPLAP